MLRYLSLWCLGIAVAVSAPAAHARRQTAYEYALKVVCGRPDRSQVAPGTYFTAVNVHNGATDSVSVRLKVAPTGADMRPGRVSPFLSVTVRPDEAIEIDCAQVLKLSRVTGFLKGFLVLQTRTPIDVVAVYTASGRSEAVEVLDVERVPARPLLTGS